MAMFAWTGLGYYEWLERFHVVAQTPNDKINGKFFFKSFEILFKF
jgi:hypothetical protein